MKALGWSGVVMALAWTSVGWAQTASPPPPSTAAKSVHVITNPDWLRKPNVDQMLAVWPLQGTQNGRAMIDCVVTTTGLLRACNVFTESPPGQGFGPAALILAQTFLMKPKLVDGVPVEGEVRVPIAFTRPYSPNRPSKNASDLGNDSHDGAYTLLGTPIWARTPTVAEILAELGRKVGDRFADGQVVLQCSVDKKTGLLGDCIIVNFGPGMTAFRGAAKSLTSKFQLAPEGLADLKNDVKVNLAFSFPDMTSVVWSGRYLDRTYWTRTPNFTPTQKTFPADAAKAGLKTGSATVDCVVGADGGLTKCTTLSESTPGVGFGPMALQIAQGFATNPWTEEGLPAEGAHVKLPIKMVDADAAEPAPAVPPSTKP